MVHISFPVCVCLYSRFLALLPLLAKKRKIKKAGGKKKERKIYVKKKERLGSPFYLIVL